MTGTQYDALVGLLEEWNSFGECLLHDVRPTAYGYGLDLKINNVWRNGQVRDNALEVPDVVTFRLLGVSSVSFMGGLTEAMLDSPEQIGWGLTEIARVVALKSDMGCALAVEWESARRLVVEFRRFEFHATSGD